MPILTSTKNTVLDPITPGMPILKIKKEIEACEGDKKVWKSNVEMQALGMVHGYVFESCVSLRGEEFTVLIVY
jgi:hypothetical protein